MRLLLNVSSEQTVFSSILSSQTVPHPYLLLGLVCEGGREGVWLHASVTAGGRTVRWVIYLRHSKTVYLCLWRPVNKRGCFVFVSAGAKWKGALCTES